MSESDQRISLAHKKLKELHEILNEMEKDDVLKDMIRTNGENIQEVRKMEQEMNGVIFLLNYILMTDDERIKKYGTTQHVIRPMPRIPFKKRKEEPVQKNPDEPDCVYKINDKN